MIASKILGDKPAQPGGEQDTPQIAQKGGEPPKAAAPPEAAPVTKSTTADKPASSSSEPESPAGATKVWAPPKEVVEKIPHEWGPGQPNKKGTGLRWTDPQKPKANIVRIDKGNPKATLPSQRPDHVVVQSNGKVLGRDGKPIVGSIQQNASAAHIPINEYRTWSKWNKL